MSRKMWLFIGGGFGFVVPFLFGALQHFGPWHVRPSAYFLFRPGLFVLAPFGYLLQTFVNSDVVLVLLVGVANAAVFGAAAYGLRKYFLTLVAALLTIVYLSLPPSDAKLESQFAERKPQFELLIQEASKTSFVVRIGSVEIEDSDGRKYREGDGQAPISQKTWTEYREIFKKTGMNEGLYRSPQTGSVQFLRHTIFGQFGPVGTLYGYVYCPGDSKDCRDGFQPCRDERNQYDDIDYRYKRIAPEWFTVEIFTTHSTIN
jgi:hypothetical protein